MNDQLHIGDTIDFDQDTDNHFAVTILPLDLFDSWERGSLLSNFAADFYKHNFPSDEEHNLISTVLNELVENAVKFSRNNSAPVKIVLKRRNDELLMQADNYLPRRRKESFISVCKEIATADLDELYVDRMHENVYDTHSSGIGLILIKKDYGESLSFDFYTDADDYPHVAVTVRLDFHDMRTQT